MPDGENRENQKPQQPGPKITEPDPNYDPNVGYLGENTSEQAHEAMFRGAAKKLAQEEEDIVDLVHEWWNMIPKPLLPDQFHCSIMGPEREAASVVSWEEDIAASEPVRVELLQGSIPRGVGVGVETDTSLFVPLNLDPATQTACQEFLEKNPNIDAFIQTYYYFDKRGNFAKSCVMPGEIVVDEDRIIKRYSGNSVLISSEMTPEDFELAGSVLDGMKSKLSAALGRNPPGPQSSNQ